ncbi:17863_t:CDS:2 [Gigaspora margarita]|uniref:17863_t:CDS:1 n=1 Tax=Gigaspora margarita TaxID=4874 RepID=A0ABN7UD28_GIGMA|nr:17863_t:CDS:2 [Gigaspora margarita]
MLGFQNNYRYQEKTPNWEIPMSIINNENVAEVTSSIVNEHFAEIPYGVNFL